jgi:hypothetical protein
MAATKDPVRLAWEAWRRADTCGPRFEYAAEMDARHARIRALRDKYERLAREAANQSRMDA